MPTFFLEECRAEYEEFERTIRLAVASARENEKLRQPKAKKTGTKEDSKEVKTGMFLDVDGEATITTTRDADLVTRALVDRAAEKVERIQQVLKDRDQMQEELDRVNGKGDSDASINLFYERLKLIQSTNPDKQVVEETLTSAQLDRQVAMSIRPFALFSGEEAGGKYLDLHESHGSFVNLPIIDPELYDYVTFLSMFYSFGSLPAELKNKAAYVKYLTNLRGYLTDFSDRVFPLKFASEHFAAIEEKTKEKMKTASAEVIDLTKYSSAEELEKGESAQALKEALLKRGMKCGGTPAQRAKRLFEASQANGSSTAGNKKDVLKSGLREHSEVLESQIKYICDEILSDTIQSTRMNVEKKLALSYEELEKERMAEEDPNAGSEEDDSDSGEEKAIHNPKDVPLGWDGKPIPYWLYKLHGLNHEFRCEVCGDITYRGPRNFERHFSEARHTHNLKMLGVQYSRYYYMVTKIEDVLKLSDKNYKQSATQRYKPEDDEEFEDNEGNVFNRKTYEDLRRQGLL